MLGNQSLEDKFKQLSEEVNNKIQTNNQQNDFLYKRLSIILTIITISLTLAVLFSGYQIFSNISTMNSTIKEFREMVDHEKKSMLNEYNNVQRNIALIPYKSRILSGKYKLENFKDKEPVKNDAIWHDLLSPLQEAKASSDFYHVVLMYREVIPLLDLRINSDEFRDYHRGIVYIFSYLLESKNNEIMNELIKNLPTKNQIKKFLDPSFEAKINHQKLEEYRESIMKLLELCKDSCS